MAFALLREEFGEAGNTNKLQIMQRLIAQHSDLSAAVAAIKSPQRPWRLASDFNGCGDDCDDLYP
jgi:hypothetical protein